MKADHQDILQYRDRRLNKGVALFLRPSGTRGTLNPFGHRDAQILVQGNKPIALGSFRKQRALHNVRMRGKKLAEARIVREPVGQASAPLDVEQSSSAGLAA